jgi:hypothetical protein
MSSAAADTASTGEGSGIKYVNWLGEVEKAGGEFRWLLGRDCSSEWRDGTRSSEAIRSSVLASENVKVFSL